MRRGCATSARARRTTRVARPCARLLTAAAAVLHAGASVALVAAQESEEEQNTTTLDTLTWLGLAAAAVVAIGLCCAIRKCCCGNTRKQDYAQQTLDAATHQTGLEQFVAAHPPRLEAPEDVDWREGVRMVLHVDRTQAIRFTNTGSFHEATSPTGSRTLAVLASAGMTNEHALLFGLENKNSKTLTKSDRHGHVTAQMLMHPTLAYQATRPLHPPKLSLNKAVYFEVTLDHIDETMPGCTVSIGWATNPYPHNHLVGLCDHSIGLMTHSGCVHASGFERGFKYLPSNKRIRHGDTIGAGYEWVAHPGSSTDKDIVFFFTLNGEKLPVLPHLVMPADDDTAARWGGAGDASGSERLMYNTKWQKTSTAKMLRGTQGSHHAIADLGKVRRPSDALRWEKEMGKTHMSHYGTTADFLPTLGRGAGYPTVSCFGSAKVRLNFQGPFVWRPSRGEQVHQTFHAVGSKRSRHSHASNRSGAAADAAELPGAVTAQDLMGALETADQNNDWGEEKKKEPSAGDLMAAMQAEGW